MEPNNTVVTNLPRPGDTPEQIEARRIPPSDYPATNTLNNRAYEVIEKTYDAAISQVENMITELTNFKSVLEIKKLAARESLKDFMDTIGHGASMINNLSELVKGIEKRHLQ